MEGGFCAQLNTFRNASILIIADYDWVLIHLKNVYILFRNHETETSFFYWKCPQYGDNNLIFIHYRNYGAETSIYIGDTPQVGGYVLMLIIFFYKLSS